jgi:NADPH:quinone reductase-like Zn-dependent oxidoreductase
MDMVTEFKAIRFREYGGSDKLELDTVPTPALNAGEVLIEVHFAGVNPIDWKIRSGYLRDFMPIQLPFTPGIDLSGVVVAVGSDVKGLKRGQAVFGIGKGTYAQYSAAEEGNLVLKPEGLSFEAAATVPVAALTAWKAVEDSGAGNGLTVVIQGAAGGVGLFAIQFATMKKAKVIGTASEDNLTFVRSLGAEKAVDYRIGSLEEDVRNADIIIDLVGGESLERAYGLLKKGGTLVTIAGQVSEEKAKSHGIKAIASGRGPTVLLKDIAKLLDEKRIHTEVGRIFPLAQAKEAHDLSQTGHGRGRILLKVR